MDLQSSFVSPFDALLATSVAPLLFLRDPEGFWRAEVDLSRDGAVRLGRAPTLERGWALARDRSTGLVTPIFTTSRELLLNHPRLEVVFYEDEAEQTRVFQALGRPPLSPGPLKPDAPRSP